MDKINHATIVGGVHGNERIGTYLVRKMQHFPYLFQRQSFECRAFLANPLATEVNRRYVDRDLNRCFELDTLSNLTKTDHESSLAREIFQKISIDGKPESHMIVDLHSSTANMGLSIFPSSQHPFNLGLCAYLSQLDPDVHICLSPTAGKLRSLSPIGCTIEVGPIAQGVIQWQLLEKTEMLLQAVLDYTEAKNQGRYLPAPKEITVYEVLSPLAYPQRSSTDLPAIIHPQIQFQDYQPLHPQNPLFFTLAGQEITYEGDSTVFPIFINEAAYYEEDVAMVLTKKYQLNLNSIL